MAKQNLSYWSLAVILFIGTLTSLPEDTQAANILGLFPISATSHNNVFSALTKELAARGHHLTVITPHPISTPPAHYDQINVYKQVEPHVSAFTKTNVVGVTEIFKKIYNLTTSCCIDVLALPEIQKLMDPKKSGKNFDLIIMSNFFTDCFLGFAHIYDVPIVQISPAGAFPHTDAQVGNVVLPSFVPNIFFSFTDRMNFFQRTVNFISTVAMIGFSNFILCPSHEEIMHQYFGDSIPSVSELHRRISLTILNNHFTMNYPRPLVPNIVECGAMHVKQPKPLTKELQSFMDGAKEGVIYFSMGSNLQSTSFPDDKRDALLSVFSKLKQKVLWKWEADGPLPGQPSNLRLQKWLPQSDLLAHPNMKLFITHGGLLSLQEAVYRGVPVIGIPFFGDQDFNMEKVINLGIGLKAPYKDFTKEKLLSAINEIISNPSYSNKMKEMSARVRDQPQTPLERAVFWTEYVIRHKGAKHLAPASLDLYWFQLYLLDVIAVVFAVPTLFFLGLFYALLRCCRKLRGSKTTPGKSTNKSKKQ